MLCSLLATTVLSAPAKGLLVVDGLAIGRLQAGKWRNLVSKKSDPMGTQKNLSFQVLGLDKPLEKRLVPKLELMDEVAEGWYTSGNGEIYFTRVMWNGTPLRFPKTIPYSPSSKEYLDVVAAHLQKVGLKGARARINQVVAVDLDGDGTREVVIEAAPFADMVPRTMEDGQITDYTAILIRCVKNGKPVTVTVAHTDARKDKVLGGADQLRAIVDFDGDGKFELVCSSDYYEGQSAAVYSFKKGSVKKLVEYGAGV